MSNNKIFCISTAKKIEILTKKQSSTAAQAIKPINTVPNAEK